MAEELKEHIKVGLNENRMIVLVVQVLLGFGFRSALEKGFETLPTTSQALKMTSLALLTLSLALLLTIPAFHRIAERGESTARFESMLRRLMGMALLPFALALGMDIAIVTAKVLSPLAGALAGGGTSALAIFLWYMFEHFRPGRSTGDKDMKEEKQEPATLKEKITQVLTECRVVLPGTQTLLGFQLIAFLTEAFDKLPRNGQLVHLFALGFIALSTILLMTPPAYHRMAEHGAETEHFLKLASRFMLASMLPLALGMSADFYVVLDKVTKSSSISIAGASTALLLFLACWVVFPLSSRNPTTSHPRN